MTRTLAAERVREWVEQSVREADEAGPLGTPPAERGMTTPEMTALSSYATYWHPGPPPYAYPCCD
jgi:hypothetical protein